MIDMVNVIKMTFGTIETIVIIQKGTYRLVNP